MAAMSMAMIGLGWAVGAETPALVPIEYRLPVRPTSIDRCRPRGDDDILVCGRRDNERDRLREAVHPEGMTLTRRSPFDWDLGGGTRGYVDLDQIERPDGFVDRRVMITVQIPF